MAKIMTLHLGGEDRTIDVGKWWFTKYYGEVSKSNDPLNPVDYTTLEGQFNFTVNMVLAGLRTHAKVNALPFDTTREQVENWLGVMEADEIKKLIDDYTELTKPIETGEATTQAANG